MKLLSMIFLVVGITTSAFAHVWPSGGASEVQLSPGSRVSITWDNAINAERVTIELWDGERNASVIIAADVPAATRRIEWVIPPDQPTGLLYRFVVRNAEKPSIALLSNGFLSIVSAHAIASGIVNEVAPRGAITLEPSPASDRVTATWDLSYAATVEIRDLNSRVLWTRSVNTATTSLDVDVRALATGMYSFVARTASGESVARPFLVQR